MSSPVRASYRFRYWSRFVARLLRVRQEYRGPFLGWGLFDAHNRLCSSRQPPVWHVSELWPWNLANRLHEYPFANVTWTVYWGEDHRKRQQKLPAAQTHSHEQTYTQTHSQYSEHNRGAAEQTGTAEPLVYRGDKVEILAGPDSGKKGTVKDVLPMPALCYIEGLNLVCLPFPSSFLCLLLSSFFGLLAQSRFLYIFYFLLYLMPVLAVTTIIPSPILSLFF